MSEQESLKRAELYWGWVDDLLRAVFVLDLVPGGLAVEGGAAEELHRVRPARASEARVAHVSLGTLLFWRH